MGQRVQETDDPLLPVSSKSVHMCHFRDTAVALPVSGVGPTVGGGDFCYPDVQLVE
jgi:hypothetical protein